MPGRPNVSPTTVSLALEGKATSRVSQATRERVVAIAERLNYRPNYVARTLATQRSHVIGLVVPTLYNPIYAEFSQELIDRASEQGYRAIVCSASGREEDQRRITTELLNRGVDGLIICSSFRGCPVVAELNERGVPLVLAMRTVERRPGCAKTDFVGMDDRLGGYRITSHLLQMGHRRIALISGPQETSTGYYRQLGSIEAFKAHGVEIDPDLMLVGDFYRQSGFAVARELLKRRRRPTAISAANDNMAVGALEALHAEGLQVPDDMALTGYDDMEMAGLSGIDLTTISQKKCPIGRVVMDKLIAKINGRTDMGAEHVLFEPVLIIRKSCGFRALREGGEAQRDETGADDGGE